MAASTLPPQPVPAATTSTPKDPNDSPGATIESPYRSRNRQGRVTFSVRRLDDPSRAGWAAVFGTAETTVPQETVPASTGFPTITARVEAESSGYENWLGWIQMVNERTPDGREIRADHDPIWFLQGRDVPYAAVGYAPTFFDAPTRPERRPVLWEADLFLCTVPSLRDGLDASTAAVEPLAGARWGFRIDRDGEAPAPIGLRPAGNWAWASWVPALRKSFPRWRFADRTASVTLDRRPGSLPP